MPRKMATIETNLIKQYNDMLEKLEVTGLCEVLKKLAAPFVGRKQTLLTRLNRLLLQHFEIVSHVIRDVYLSTITAKQLEYLKANCVQSVNQTREFIKQIITGDADCMGENNAKISLKCPLSSVRMSLPCRSKLCTHLQCFDAKFYLELQALKQKWECPVCKNRAQMSDLAIDSYFQEVLASPLLGEENDILVHKDGSWSKMQEHVPTAVFTLNEPIVDLTGPEDDILFINLLSSDEDD